MSLKELEERENTLHLVPSLKTTTIIKWRLFDSTGIKWEMKQIINKNLLL